MLYVEDNGTIRLTRGDSAWLSVAIDNVKSDDSIDSYDVTSDDTLTLSVKKKVKDENYLFSKTVTGSTSIYIKPDDTKGIPFGKYIYDVQLTTGSGDVFTIVEPSTFEILPEVTT